MRKLDPLADDVQRMVTEFAEHYLGNYPWSTVTLALAWMLHAQLRHAVEEAPEWLAGSLPHQVLREHLEHCQVLMGMILDYRKETSQVLQ